MKYRLFIDIRNNDYLAILGDGRSNKVIAVHDFKTDREFNIWAKVIKKLEGIDVLKLKPIYR